MEIASFETQRIQGDEVPILRDDLFCSLELYWRKNNTYPALTPLLMM
jgi:hypothetical protein